MLSDKAIKEFKVIYEEDYGITCEDVELGTMALEFLKFFALIYKEQKPDTRLVEEKYQVCDNKGASNLNRLTRRNSRLG